MSIPENFLLTDPLAVRLYDTVKDLPLIDYHNHLSIRDLAQDRPYENLTELWIGSDPYKHRAMRICGIEERRITGEASPYEKFEAWSQVLGLLPGNPLYDWSRLELRRIFGIEEELNPSTAERIWNKANELLKKKEYSPRGLLQRFHVEYAAPCVLPGEDLTPFAELDGVVPSLRGDDLVNLTSPLLAEAGTLKDLRTKLGKELDRLHSVSCRFADHALDCGFTYMEDDSENEARFAALKQGKLLPEEDRIALSCEILRILGSLYAERNWTLQLHIGALRQTSSRLRTLAGPAGGYAAIGNSCNIRSLVHLLDDLEKSPSGLPRVILYTLNPADHAMFAVLSGSFPGNGERGKVTLGPAWWYCDHIHGMRDSLENIAVYGVLSVFPGMTTDSRSLLSFVRHEYFRRVFCNFLAEKVRKMELVQDFEILKSLAEKVCYYNAKTLIHQ